MHTHILVRLHTFGKPSHAVLLSVFNYVIFVAKSLMTVFVD